jgi:shikimate kinase
MGDGSTGIVLIGMRRSGKSQLGAMLALHVGRSFLDLDNEIERRVSRSIQRIIEEDGLIAFRRKESEILSEVVQQPSLVLATGGGTPTRSRNRRRLRSYGRVLFIDVSASTLIERLDRDSAPQSRPLIAGRNPKEEIVRLFQERRGDYLETAHQRINGEGSLDVVLQRLISALSV